MIMGGSVAAAWPSRRGRCEGAGTPDRAWNVGAALDLDEVRRDKAWHRCLGWRFWLGHRQASRVIRAPDERHRRAHSDVTGELSERWLTCASFCGIRMFIDEWLTRCGTIHTPARMAPLAGERHAPVLTSSGSPVSRIFRRHDLCLVERASFQAAGPLDGQCLIPAGVLARHQGTGSPVLPDIPRVDHRSARLSVRGRGRQPGRAG